MDLENWINLKIDGIPDNHYFIRVFEGVVQIKRAHRDVLKKSGKVYVMHPYREKILKEYINKRGYAHISICYNGIGKPRRMHRLVANAYIPNPENKPDVNHIDGNKSNNHPSNLEWCTPSENQHHALCTGLYTKKLLSDEQVIEIRKNYANSNLQYKEIAFLYGVEGYVISSILRNITYRFLL